MELYYYAVAIAAICFLLRIISLAITYVLNSGFSNTNYRTTSFNKGDCVVLHAALENINTPLKWVCGVKFKITNTARLVVW